MQRDATQHSAKQRKWTPDFGIQIPETEKADTHIQRKERHPGVSFFWF